MVTKAVMRQVLRAVGVCFSSSQEQSCFIATSVMRQCLRCGLLCNGTLFHATAMVRPGGGTTSSRKRAAKFSASRVAWAGWFVRVTCDRITITNSNLTSFPASLVTAACKTVECSHRHSLRTECT